MRFLLYNIRYGTGAGEDFHFPVPFSGYLRRTNTNLRRITEFIKTVQPDIVGLIEVDSGSFRSAGRNQAEIIADDLEHYHVYQSKYRPNALIRRLPVFSKQGNAFLTGQQIKTQTFHYFSEGIKRLVIELELEQCTIFLVHLSLKYRHRQNQLGDLYELIKQVKKPVIVAGDFNAYWGDQELQLFLGATGLENANKDSAPSHPSWAPRMQLDFILHSADITIRRFDIPHVHYSDHLPLVCDFDVM
jgi:endonuclease/exonuclease/phosphatase family metal-dependent hydrolase